MKIVLTTALYLIVLFILPLLGTMDELFDTKVILSAIVILLLLNTQPPTNFKEGSRDRSTDKGTMYLILVTGVIGHIGSLIDWAYFPSFTVGQSVLVGAFLMIFGIIFRIVAIQSLKYGFSSSIRIKEGQQLFTRGLYSKLRHPSYTAAWILMIGDALLFQSYFGLAILGVGMFLVYMKRIQVEEEVLLKKYGKEYEDYMQRTWKFLPWY